jgi:hypothetical protein
MRLFFIITLFIVINAAKSKHSMPTKIIAEKEIEYPSEDTVEIEEVFNVCIFPDEPAVDLEAWKKYLNDSLILDDASLDTIPSGSYTVIVKFAVGEKGRLSKISILKILAMD